MADVPTGVSLSPQLSVRRGRAAVAFYKAAFGAEELYRVGGTDQHEEVVAQLAVGEATFWVADESPAHLNFSPESLGGGTVRMLLTVADPAPSCNVPLPPALPRWRLSPRPTDGSLAELSTHSATTGKRKAAGGLAAGGRLATERGSALRVGRVDQMAVPPHVAVLAPDDEEHEVACYGVGYLARRRRLDVHE